MYGHIFMALATTLVRVVFVYAVIAATAEVSTSHILKGKVTCLDCDAAYDLSGVVVMAKCTKVRKVVTATTTTKDGDFEMELPSDECEARLGGSRNHLYATKKDMVAEIVKTSSGGSSADYTYGTSTRLAFCSKCRCRSIDNETNKYCKATARKFGSSKTFNLPLPPEWGLAPSSYYFPFFPIIGIP